MEHIGHPNTGLNTLPRIPLFSLLPRITRAQSGSELGCKSGTPTASCHQKSVGRWAGLEESSYVYGYTGLIFILNMIGFGVAQETNLWVCL